MVKPPKEDNTMAAKRGTPYAIPPGFKMFVHTPTEVEVLPCRLTFIPRKPDEPPAMQTVATSQEDVHIAALDGSTTSIGVTAAPTTVSLNTSTKSETALADGGALANTVMTEDPISTPADTSDHTPASSLWNVADNVQYAIHEEDYQAIMQLVRPALQLDCQLAASPLPNAIVLGVDTEKALGLSDAVIEKIANCLGTALVSLDPEDLEDLASSCHRQQAQDEEDVRLGVIAAKLREATQLQESIALTSAGVVNGMTSDDLAKTSAPTDAAISDALPANEVETSSSSERTTSEATLSSSTTAADGVISNSATNGITTPISAAIEIDIADEIAKTSDTVTARTVNEVDATAETISDGKADGAEANRTSFLDESSFAKQLSELIPGYSRQPQESQDDYKLRIRKAQQDALRFLESDAKISTAPEAKKQNLEKTVEGLETESEAMELDNAQLTLDNIRDTAAAFLELNRRLDGTGQAPPPVGLFAPAPKPGTTGAKTIPTDMHRPSSHPVDTAVLGLDDWCHAYDEHEIQSPYGMTARYLGKGQIEDPFSRSCFESGHHSRRLTPRREHVRTRGAATLKYLLAEQAIGFDTTSKVEDLPAVILHIRYANLLLDEVLHGDIFKRLLKIINELRVVFHRKIVLLISLVQSRTQKKDPFGPCSDPDCEACTQDDMPRMMRALYGRRMIDGPTCRTEKIPRALAKALNLTPANYIAAHPAGELPELPINYTTAGLNLRRLNRAVVACYGPHAPYLEICDPLSKEALNILADWDIHTIRRAAAQFAGRCMIESDRKSDWEYSYNDFILDMHRQGSNVAGSKDATVKLLDDKAAKFSAEFEKKLAKVRKICDESERRVLDSIIKPNTNRTTYEDVILDEDTKTAVKQLISLYKVKTTCTSEKLLKMLNINGAMFFGPPGTGKTHLCRAMANDQRACMLAVDPAVVRSKWVGDNEKLAKAAFSVAKKMSPCILFIDEADSLFAKRSSEDRSYERASLDIFLQQMDGIKTDKKGPFVVVATNRPADIDEAFLRRLPHKVLFKLPSEQQRERILTLYLGTEDIDQSVDVADLAKQTAGFSGSDLKTLCGQAVLAWATEKDIGDNMGEDDMHIKLSASHFKIALKRTHATVSRHTVKELEDWQNSAMGSEPFEHQTMYS